MKPLILFLCPHGAAKSVLAATYCQQLATQQGLDLQTTFAGNDPDPEVYPSVIELLASEGLEVAHHTPRHVTHEELENAYRIISVGCDVSDMVSPEKQIECWNDVPMVSDSLLDARNAIYSKVERLVEELKHTLRDQK